MDKHRQRLLDRQFQVAMAAKTHSSNPVEVAIGRQGQALRRSCLSSKDSSIASSVSSIISSNDPLSRVSSNLTDVTEPVTQSQLDKVLRGVPKWRPGSFGRPMGSRRSLSYDNILGEGPKLSRRSKSAPPEREEGLHDKKMRLFGSCYTFSAKPPDSEQRSYNQLPLSEKKKRVQAVRDAQYITGLVQHFPAWKDEIRGSDRYRMVADLPYNDVFKG